jgi:hypothetical protein
MSHSQGRQCQVRSLRINVRTCSLQDAASVWLCTHDARTADVDMCVCVCLACAQRTQNNQARRTAG